MSNPASELDERLRHQQPIWKLDNGTVYRELFRGRNGSYILRCLKDDRDPAAYYYITSDGVCRDLLGGRINDQAFMTIVSALQGAKLGQLSRAVDTWHVRQRG